jgi:hypothetical protein
MKKKSNKRRLFEVVGALDKTFKLKIHENRQPLNERNWEYTINITQPWEAYDEQEDVAAFRVSILDILRNASEDIMNQMGEDISMELETSVIDEFQAGEDVEDMDYALGQLFDWADENNVWIEKMASGIHSSSEQQPQAQPQAQPQQNVDNSQWKGMSMNEEPGQEVTYDILFKELSQVISGGAVLKVMEILKKHNLVQGELQGDIEWLFNFVGGGWNSTYAKTREEAEQKIKQEYEGKANLVPDFNTIRPSTKGDYEANMSNFD